MFLERGFDIALPKVVKIRQFFGRQRVMNTTTAAREALLASSLSQKIRPGHRVAIGVGSRGVAEIDKIARGAVEAVKALGAEPFIVPAMGSHGGATAEGQTGILADYGITPETMDAPVRSSLEVVCLGEMSDGTPIYFDKTAYEADAVIPINRVKVHTDFTGDLGSGVLKLMVIGLGKHKGASTIHRRGLKCLRRSLTEASQVIMAKAPIAVGLAVVENAYHEPAIIQALEPEVMEAEEKRLLARSKELMAKLPVEQLDVLVVDEIGKDVSGSGMDTNIIGRLMIPGEQEFTTPRITKIVALHLTPASHGNAVGIGLADFTTRELVDQVDFFALYTNMVTATYVQRGMIPITLDSEEEAIKIAVDTCWHHPSTAARLIVVKNTSELEYLYVSTALAEELAGRPDIAIVGQPEELRFDANRRLVPLSYSE